MPKTKIPYADQVLALRAELQEVSAQLYELYNECCDNTEPEVYGAIFGLHERIDVFLAGGYGNPQKRCCQTCKFNGQCELQDKNVTEQCMYVMAEKDAEEQGGEDGQDNLG